VGAIVEKSAGAHYPQSDQIEVNLNNFVKKCSQGRFA
jgi:hypothetical protein